MTVEIFQRANDGLFDWEPAHANDAGTITAATSIGSAAFPEWFNEVDMFFYFNREQIDMFAAVLRLNGIEVIER